MLDEMIDGCGSLLGITMACFDSGSLWENRGTLAFMTEDLERKPHRREREGETVQFRDGHRGSSCLHAYPYKAPSLDDIFQSIRYSVVDW